MSTSQLKLAPISPYKLVFQHENGTIKIAGLDLVADPANLDLLAVAGSSSSSLNLFTIEGLLNQAWNLSSSYLKSFAADPQFEAKMASVFGGGNDYRAWQTAFATGNFEGIPTFEVLDGDVLQGANGAYVGSLNTIFFSSNFLQAYQDQPEVVASVFLEEFGHSVDWQVNAVDTVGDEGELFSAIVRDLELSQGQVQGMKQENDSVVLNLGGSLIGGEMSDDYKFDFNPVFRQLINDGGKSYVVYMNGIRTVADKFQKDLIGFNKMYNFYGNINGEYEKYTTFLEQTEKSNTFGSINLDITYRNTTDSTGSDLGDLGIFVAKFLFNYALDKFSFAGVLETVNNSKTLKKKLDDLTEKLNKLTNDGADSEDIKKLQEQITSTANQLDSIKDVVDFFETVKVSFEFISSLVKTPPNQWFTDDSFTAKAFFFLKEVSSFIPGFGEISSVIDAAIEAAPADLKEALEQYWYKETKFPEINSWVNPAQEWLSQSGNNSLILLGHSQGNFFLEDGLITMGQNSSRTSVLSLASPTSYLFAGGINKYKTEHTSSNDIIYGNDPVTKLRFISEPNVWDKIYNILQLVGNIFSLGDHPIENYFTKSEVQSYFETTFYDLHPQGFYFPAGKVLEPGQQTSDDDWIEGSGKLEGGDRNDVLRGKDDSNDNLVGGKGYDLLDGGVGGSDTADYSYSLNKIIVRATNYADSDVYKIEDGFGTVDTVGNVETIKGSSHADEMYGGNHTDNFMGENENDSLHGGGGNDFLSGGDHDDYLYGDDHNDELWEIMEMMNYMVVMV